MKIECSCGAKYQFELRPEMRDHPVEFICPACGLNSSAFVDGLIRRELGQSATPGGAAIPLFGDSRAPTGLVLPAAYAPPSRVSLQKPAEAVESPGPAASQPGFCLKHPGEVATARCYICSKPICPKCMELFGYVCSPLCKAKAASHGINLPVYDGQRSMVEARRWRKVVWVGTSMAALVVLLLALWLWYAWFGCLPKPVFSVRFPQPAYSGQSIACGEHHDQIVFLHGSTLARYDLKSGKEIWSRQLLDESQIQRAVQLQLKADKAIVDKAISDGLDRVPQMPSPEEVARKAERDAAAALALLVRGQSVWVAAAGKLARFDWATGKTLNELPVPAGSGDVINRGGEVLFVDDSVAPPAVTHVDLLTGQTRLEDLAASAARLPTETASKPGHPASAPSNLAGLPGQDGAGKPMDPDKVAAEAQHMSLARKIALPALLAANMNQQRALNELNDQGHPRATPAGPEPGSSFSLIPAKAGFVELTVKLLEARIVSRSAMKPVSGKSALDGDLAAGKSMEMSNDMLNEMQRSNGGDTVQEDHSRYQVTVRRPGSGDAWTGEVEGPPKVYPLETVNVLTAGKLMIVLDKANRKLWQSALGFNMPPGINALDEESATYGRGPCVERRGSLYVFDQGVLAAFDLPTGNAHWRLPTVGVAGIFFDDDDMIYVNTTTAAHESLKYSRQIDLSRKVLSVILKVDSHNGKILWTAQSQCLVNYVSGRLILAALSYQPAERDDDTQAETGPWLRIRRLHPDNGRVLWEHFQERAPLDIAFDQNTIRLVFKKEVQILRFPRF